MRRAGERRLAPILILGLAATCAVSVSSSADASSIPHVIEMDARTHPMPATGDAAGPGREMTEQLPVAFTAHKKHKKHTKHKHKKRKKRRARHVSPPTSACNPSGQPMPSSDPAGWRRVFADDFLTDVPVGQFPGTVYGASWGAYPDGWRDTTRNGTYMPSKVLSVRECTLDYFIHTENGVHMVSAPTPKIPAGAYGRYDVRFRADPLPGYKTAWLLWPDSSRWPADGEIDFPEGNLDDVIKAFMHFANPLGGQNGFSTSARYPTWHTASTIWQPGKVTFVLDGTTIGTSTTQVPTTPMHWVLQTETATDGTVPNNTTQGHVQIDWVVAYKAS